jgi:hypothetical protein
MVPGWVAWLACGGPPGSEPTVPDPEPTAETAHSSVPTSPSPTADTAAQTTSFPDDCDPEVHAPPLPGSEEPGPVDAHQDVLGADPAPFGLHLSMPGSDPSVSVAWVWRTDVATLASVVELRTPGGPTERLVGASFRYGGVAGTDHRVHEVKQCRTLSPGTTYEYRVGGEGAFSEWRTFSTPRADARSVRVAIAGDSRGSYLQWALILQGLSLTRPDLYLFAGDLVTRGTDQAEWDLWFRAGEEVLPGTVLLPAHGNHELLAAHWFAQWSLPGNELWYQVRQGPLHLVVLNDTATTEELELQATYVRDVLGASDATWKVVMEHQSAYATCSRHGSNLTLRERWVPAFQDAGVDLVIGGHNHVYERSVPLWDGAEVAPDVGITYLVTGGAGAPLYPGFDPEPWSAVAVAREHAILADFGLDDARFEVREQTGALLDAFTLPAD